MEQKYQDLVKAAQEIIKKRYKPDIHTVGAALLTKKGKCFPAVHLEAYIGRVAVCAEAIAIGMAAAQGDTNIDAIVAVDQHGHIVSPCGICRELISDYTMDAKVILSADSVVPIINLLPHKYIRQS